MNDKLLILAARVIVHLHSTGNNFELGEKVREEYNKIFKADEEN